MDDTYTVYDSGGPMTGGDEVSSLYETVEEGYDGIGADTYGDAYGDGYGIQAGQDDGASDSEPAAEEERPAAVRQWMRELQEVGDIAREMMSLGAHPTGAFDSYSKIFQDFRETAKNVGRTIISEMHLPDTDKTIRPISLGGVAGGQKLVHSGILFKFAADAQMSDQSFMYGGPGGPDLAKANKACGHELKSLDAFYNVALELGISSQTHVPLMALVDYRGSRLVAVSFLPITHDTLVLGSNDGRSCVNLDVEAFSLTSLVCETLGLEAHRVGGTTVPACGDLEVHRGTDGKLYVLDFARVLPPEHPLRGVRPGRKIFYELLRPELARVWFKGGRLCSDALSGWGRSDPNWKRHNETLLEASSFMREEQVAVCAKYLDSMVKGNDQFQSVVVRQAVQIFDDLSATLHRFGINMRHIGKVRDKATRPYVRMLLLTAMVARVCKAALISILREQAKRLKLAYEVPFQMSSLSYINMLRGHGGKESIDFWTKKCHLMLEKKYGSATVLESDVMGIGRPLVATDLSVRVCMPLLSKFLVTKIGYEWKRDPLAEFITIQGGLDTEVQLAACIIPGNGVLRDPMVQLVETDLRNAMQPIVTMSNLGLWTMGRSLMQSSFALIDSMLFLPALDLLRHALDHLEQASKSVSSNNELLVDRAYALWQIYLVESELEIETNKLRDKVLAAHACLETAKEQGCSSNRLLIMQVVVAISASVLFRNSTQSFDPRMEVMSASEIRSIVHRCFEGDFGKTFEIFHKVLADHPISARRSLFLVLLLLYDHRGMDAAFREKFLRRIITSWLISGRNLPLLTISNMIRWAGTLNIIGQTKTQTADEVPAGAIMTQDEWAYGRVLHCLLSEAFAIPSLKQELQTGILNQSLGLRQATLQHLLGLPTRGLYSINDERCVVRDTDSLITGDDDVYDFVRTLLKTTPFPTSHGTPSVGAVLQYYELVVKVTDFVPLRCTFKNMRTFPAAAAWDLSQIQSLQSSPMDGLDVFGLQRILVDARNSLTSVDLKFFNEKWKIEPRHLLLIKDLPNLTSLTLRSFAFKEQRKSLQEGEVSAETVLQSILAARHGKLGAFRLVDCQFPDTLDLSSVPEMTGLTEVELTVSSSSQKKPVVRELLETKLVTKSCQILTLNDAFLELNVPTAQLHSLTFGALCPSELVEALLTATESFPSLNRLAFESRSKLSGLEVFKTMTARFPALKVFEAPETQKPLDSLWDHGLPLVMGQLEEFSCRKHFFTSSFRAEMFSAKSLTKIQMVEIPDLSESAWKVICATSSQLADVELSLSGRDAATSRPWILASLANVTTLKRLYLKYLGCGSDFNGLFRQVLTGCPMLVDVKLDNVFGLTEDAFGAVLEDEDTLQRTKKAFSRLEKIHIINMQGRFKAEFLLRWVCEKFSSEDLSLEEFVLSDFSPTLYLHIRRFTRLFPSIMTRSH